MFGQLISWNKDAFDLSEENRITIGGITIESAGIGKGIRQALNDESRRLFNQHGSKAFENPRSSAAIHEAGHVIVYVVTGMRVRRTQIREAVPGCWIGLTEPKHRKAVRLETPERCLDMARVLYAGYMAERMFDPNFREASSIDEIIASQAAGAIAANMLEIDQEKCWREKVHPAVCNYLRHNHAVVQAIGECLYTQNKIEGQQLDRLCAGIKTEGRN
jgi:hypothetical protein